MEIEIGERLAEVLSDVVHHAHGTAGYLILMVSIVLIVKHIFQAMPK